MLWLNEAERTLKYQDVTLEITALEIWELFSPQKTVNVATDN